MLASLISEANQSIKKTRSRLGVQWNVKLNQLMIQLI